MYPVSAYRLSVVRECSPHRTATSSDVDQTCLSRDHTQRYGHSSILGHIENKRLVTSQDGRNRWPHLTCRWRRTKVQGTNVMYRMRDKEGAVCGPAASINRCDLLRTWPQRPMFHSDSSDVHFTPLRSLSRRAARINGGNRATTWVVKGVVWQAIDVRIECSCWLCSSADATVIVTSESTRKAQPHKQQQQPTSSAPLVGWCAQMRGPAVRSKVVDDKVRHHSACWVVAIVDRREARLSLPRGATCPGWSSREKAENACHPSVRLSVVSTINTFITKRKDLSSVCPAAWVALAPCC